MMKDLPFKIAIVGVGPKGLYGFERILAELKANWVEVPVEIHLFNKTAFMGSGDVYRSDQPKFLLMNFSNEYINMWPEESPAPIIKRPLSFSKYLMQEHDTTPEKMDPLYCSRATVGDYLEKGFAELCLNLPKNVQLHKHIAEVGSIDKVGECYSIFYKQQRETHRLDDFRNILITTGHQRHKVSVKKKQNTIPFIYPVQKTLQKVTEQHIVAVKGMGLTFIDAVLAITDGKGGTFEETSNGTYIYQASGMEPKHIFPFSKSGWPMLPKYNFDPKDNEPTLYVENLKYLTNNNLNLTKDILPLLQQDMEYAYYHTLFTHENEKLTHHPEYKFVKDQIETFHNNHPTHPRFSFENLLEPDFDTNKSVHQNVLNYLIAFTVENNRNIVHEAQLRSAAVWKKISPVFNDIYSFSGLDAASHQKFDEHYFGKLNRVAYGPPPENLKKIIALAQAGILDFRFAKNPKIKDHEKGITLSNDTSEISCDIFIDARIPKNNIEKEASGLYRSLCRNQLARPYVNRIKSTTYATGTVEIDHNGALINPQGAAENITLYGTPTEGMVHDNDTLCRTRNNFAGPWAQGVIQQIIKRKDEANNKTSHTISYSQ